MRCVNLQGTIKRLIVMIKRFFNIPLIEDNPIF